MQHFIAGLIVGCSIVLFVGGLVFGPIISAAFEDRSREGNCSEE